MNQKQRRSGGSIPGANIGKALTLFALMAAIACAPWTGSTAVFIDGTSDILGNYSSFMGCPPAAGEVDIGGLVCGDALVTNLASGNNLFFQVDSSGNAGPYPYTVPAGQNLAITRIDFFPRSGSGHAGPRMDIEAGPPLFDVFLHGYLTTN